MCSEVEFAVADILIRQGCSRSMHGLSVASVMYLAISLENLVLERRLFHQAESRSSQRAAESFAAARPV